MRGFLLQIQPGHIGKLPFECKFVVRTGCNDNLWIKLTIIHRYFDYLLKFYNSCRANLTNTALQTFHIKSQLSTGMWKTRPKFTGNQILSGSKDVDNDRCTKIFPY